MHYGHYKEVKAVKEVKEIKEHAMPERRSKSVKEILIGNLPWIITTLLAIGAFITTVKYQGEAIASSALTMAADHERIVEVEKSLVRIESIQDDISEMKSDIKDIKRIILRPAFIGMDAKIVTLENTQSNIAMNKP